MKIVDVEAWVLGLVVAVVAAGLCTSCTPQQAQTATNVVVKVTDALCTEEASDPSEPDWVKLACQVEGGVAHVIMPRAQWQAMKSAHAAPADAGAQ